MTNLIWLIYIKNNALTNVPKGLTPKNKPRDIIYVNRVILIAKHVLIKAIVIIWNAIHVLRIILDIKKIVMWNIIVKRKLFINRKAIHK